MEKVGVPMEREFFIVRGEEMYWQSYIQMIKEYISDNYRRFSGNEDAEKALFALELMEDLAYDYSMKEENTIDEYKERFDRCRIGIGKTDKLPEALDVLLSDIESVYGNIVNLSSYIDNALEKTKWYYDRIVKKHKIEDRKKDIVKSLLRDREVDTSTAIGKIEMIMYLQNAKKNVAYVDKNDDKHNLEKEKKAADLWCSILVKSMVSTVINNAQMLMLVMDRFMDESEMTDLLKKYEYKWDYEYYSENVYADLSDDTMILIDDVMEIVEPRFRKLIHID